MNASEWQWEGRCAFEVRVLFIVYALVPGESLTAALAISGSFADYHYTGNTTTHRTEFEVAPSLPHLPGRRRHQPLRTLTHTPESSP